ncbi:hypothetical protein CDAR_35631 [Caerostris darwini]|uniref:Uncharacterized protein n=1 Tax=Caerostris darwini TaxID=1538125 RepID=A0AAV4VDI6_9ARAC|nr:hypothetical protein CDAR_35631 [Caerostris darwini]
MDSHGSEGTKSTDHVHGIAIPLHPGQFKGRLVVPPSNPMYLQRVEGVAKQIVVVKRNDSFKGAEKKKGTCECPPKMASSRQMRHPEPSIGAYWKV